MGENRRKQNLLQAERLKLNCFLIQKIVVKREKNTKIHEKISNRIFLNVKKCQQKQKNTKSHIKNSEKLKKSRRSYLLKILNQINLFYECQKIAAKFGKKS